MDMEEAALKYCFVRRFGSNGKVGTALDAYVNKALGNSEVRRRCLKDADEMFSDAIPDDLLGLNAMIAE